MKQRLKDRLKKPTYHFLSDSISDSRNAERSEFLSLGVFGNPHSSQWLGDEGTSRLQVTLECSQIGVEVFLEHRNADFVDSRGTSVPFDRFECLHPSAGRRCDR